MSQLSSEEIYNMIHRAMVDKGANQIDADAIATQVKDAVQNRSRYNLESLKDNLRRDRERRLEQLRGRFLWISIPLVVVSLLAFGGYKLEQTDDTDYAGYPPETAVAHADDAIAAWYGQDNLPTQLELVRQPERSLLRGQKAWKVTFDNPNICAFVWEDGVAYTNEYKILEGSDC